MTELSLTTLEIEGFKSFKKPFSIPFPQKPGLYFINGDNQVDPLGANGAGKSSIFDAICFCLEGVSTRGKRASELQAWGADKVAVSTHWKAGKGDISVQRSGSPNRLLMDGKPVEQEKVDRTFGRSRTALLNSVIFAQGVPTFYDISVPERGALLDEVLDLELWMRLSARAGKKIAVIEDEITEVDKDIAHLEGRIEALANTSDIERQQAEWRVNWRKQVDVLIDEIEAGEKEYDELANNLRHAQRKLKEFPPSDRSKLNDIERKIAVLEANSRTHQEKIADKMKVVKFFLNHTTCPICDQLITQSLRDRNRANAEGDIGGAKAAIVTLSLTMNQLIKQREGIEAEVSKNDRKRTHFEGECLRIGITRDALEQKLNRLEKQIDVLDKQENPFTQMLKSAEAQVEKNKKEVNSLQRKKLRLNAQTADLKYWKDGFKRVRLFQIKRTLTHLELEVAGAAASIGLMDYKITFHTEIETASGTMKAGVQIKLEGKEKAGREWSPGELQRVRLAIVLGVASLIQRASGIAYSLEVFDEPTNWLSGKGIEEFLEVLKRRAILHKKTIFLVDHRALTYSGFDGIWHVIKDQNGSRVEMH